jgi:hypothetical protein
LPPAPRDARADTLLHPGLRRARSTSSSTRSTRRPRASQASTAASSAAARSLLTCVHCPAVPRSHPVRLLPADAPLAPSVPARGPVQGSLLIPAHALPAGDSALDTRALLPFATSSSSRRLSFPFPRCFLTLRYPCWHLERRVPLSCLAMLFPPFARRRQGRHGLGARLKKSQTVFDGSCR